MIQLNAPILLPEFSSASNDQSESVIGCLRPIIKFELRSPNEALGSPAYEWVMTPEDDGTLYTGSLGEPRGRAPGFTLPASI
jgi:hypothetical protein